MQYKENIKDQVLPTDLITTKELCNLLKVNPNTLANWRKNKNLPYYKKEKTIRYSKSAVLKWFAEQ